MKFINASKREFKAVGINKAHSDYLGNGIITKGVEMTTGYRGRGLLPLSHTFNPGTQVKFTLKQYRNYETNDVYTDLEISATLGDDEYKVSHKIMEPLDVAANILGIDSIAKVFEI